MRIQTSLLFTVGLAVSLTACSAAAPKEVSTDCAATASGSVSDAVEVTGDFGTKPEVVFDIPVTAAETERTVVIAGPGAVVEQGDVVDVQFSIYSGANSADIAGTDWTDAGVTEIPIDETKFRPGFVKTIQCSTVGSRVVGVIPPVDAFGAEGSPDLGVGAEDDIVFVVDIVAIQPPAAPVLPRADGEDQPPADGLPTVVLDDDGRPTVTIPDQAPPTELQLAVLKKGSGQEVADGDDVVVHYQGTNWNTNTIFDESWARGEPASFNTNAVIAGFTAALVGQTVGSQVIVVIPPDQGYGAAGSPPNIGGTDTLVFVVDILGIG